MEEWIYLHGLVGIREIGHGFSLYLHDKSPYRQTDNTVGSSVSNRCIYPIYMIGVIGASSVPTIWDLYYSCF